MGRTPCCDKANVKKGPWSTEEDAKLKEYIEKNGTGGNWIALPQKAGLIRCGKSCRLRWLNYLRPNIKHGDFSEDEDRLICNLYVNIGSRWSIIAAQLPGRTDNDIKNYWNTKLKKKFIRMIPSSHMRRPQQAINHQLISPYQTSASPLSHLSPLPALSPSSSGYNFSNNSYNNSSSGAPASSFSGYYEAISLIPSTTVMNTTTCSSNASNTTFIQTPDSHVSNNGFLMFGREASCSSSDRSYNSNHQVNNIKGMEFDYGKFYGSEYMGFQGYSDCTRVDGNQKMTMASNSAVVVNGFSEKANAFYGETPFDYSLEETRQLINSKFSDNLNFFADEISKTAEEKVMYYFR